MALISKLDLIGLQKSLRTDEAIARKLKVTRQRVHQLRKKYGIKSGYAKHPQRNKEILSMFRGGMPATKIAKKFGLSAPQIYRLVCKMRGKRRW
jgi:Mor family transcriptional regulator